MKILHVIAGCDRADGGPIEGVINLGAAFREMGHSQELLTLDDPQSDAVCDAPMVVHAMGRASDSYGTGPFARLGKWARRSPEAVNWLRDNAAEYDGIIVDGLWNYATRAARLALVDSGVPYVVFPHGMLDPWFRTRYPLKHIAKTLLWQINEGPLLRNANAAAFTCEQERILARETWKPWGIPEAVVGFGTRQPPAFSQDMHRAFVQAVPEVAGKPYLLFLSRLHEKKGCEVLLSAFGEITQKYDVDLVMAGPGDPDYVASLQSLAARVAPQGRVHWPGMLKGSAKWGALYNCEAMTLTSHQENFGVVVAEALACGRPVIISNKVNIYSEIESAGGGVICEDNSRSATLVLSHFLGLGAEEKAVMGLRGSELFAAQFGIDGVAVRLIEILQGSRR